MLCFWWWRSPCGVVASVFRACLGPRPFQLFSAFCVVFCLLPLVFALLLAFYVPGGSGLAGLCVGSGLHSLVLWLRSVALFLVFVFLLFLLVFGQFGLVISVLFLRLSVLRVPVFCFASSCGFLASRVFRGGLFLGACVGWILSFGSFAVLLLHPLFVPSWRCARCVGFFVVLASSLPLFALSSWLLVGVLVVSLFLLRSSWGVSLLWCRAFVVLAVGY